MRTDLKEIIDLVSEVSDIDIRCKNRSLEYFYARQIFYKLAREVGYSLQSIGNEIGITHPSVLNALKKFDEDVKEGNNLKTYKICFNRLGLIDDKEDEAEEQISELILDVLSDLKALSDSEVSEFVETRLKPFKMMLESRKHTKEYKEPVGARLIHQL